VRAWQVFVVVENTGESQVALKTDSTSLRFRIGNVFQSGYTATLHQPSWLGTSSTILAGKSTDSLRFNVTTTGQNTGVLQLWAKAGATETNSNAYRVGLDNGTTAVTVQSPPSIAYIGNSLEPKTPNISGAYAFKVKMRNTGGATLNLLAPTRIQFTGGGVTFQANVDLNFSADFREQHHSRGHAAGKIPGHGGAARLAEWQRFFEQFAVERQRASHAAGAIAGRKHARDANERDAANAKRLGVGDGGAQQRRLCRVIGQRARAIAQCR